MARQNMYRKLPFQGGEPRLVSEVVNNCVEGKTNNTGEITLNSSGATSTVIYDERIGFDSVILLDPITENAADDKQPYGAFSNTNAQTFASANTVYSVALNTTDDAYAMSLASNKITVLHTGTYNLAYSLQLANYSASTIGDVWVWLAINGTNVPNTASIAAVPSTHGGIEGYTLMTANFFIELNKDDYVELKCATDLTDVEIDFYAAQTSPFVRPSVPSSVVTLNMIAPLNTVYVNNYLKGQATIYHLPNYDSDRTFRYIVVG
jgi:hypothetical protein